MRLVRKMRRESFGGIIYSEQPGFTAFIDNKYADNIGIEKVADLPKDFFCSPLDVHMKITNKCNLHCKGCYSIDGNERSSEMSFDLAKSIIDKLAELNVFTVSFGGGEPLLYPHIFELAQYTRNKNIAPNITSNGVNIDYTVAKHCKVFASIHLSLHSIDDIEILEPAIKNLKKAGIIPGINLLLTEEICNELDKVFAWMSKMNITRVLALRFKITSVNEKYKSMQLLTEQEKSLYPILKKLSRKYKILLMIDCSLFPTLAIHKPNKKELEQFDVNGCMGGNMYIAIDIDGSYRPCSFWPKTFGNVRELTFKEWQVNKDLIEFRKGKSNLICGNCNYGELCNYGCRLLKTQVCQG